MNNLTTITETAPAPVLDVSMFEQMHRVAEVMAASSLVPDSLIRDMSAKGPDKPMLPQDRITANCFLVVNQSVRWGLDPFAVAQHVSVVHGKLCYEGKLVSAVIDAKIGLKLKHYFAGEGEDMRIYLSDVALTENEIAALKPSKYPPHARMIDGSVREWKTTGNNSPWRPGQYPRMLVYRGTRDWCRMYEPALMLGVYTPDEMTDARERSAAAQAKDVTPLVDRLSGPKTGDEGFSRDHVSDAIAEATGDDAGAEEQDDGATDDDPTMDEMAQDAKPTENVVEFPHSPQLYQECADKFIDIATRNTSETAEARHAAIGVAKDAWKQELPNDHEFVKECMTAAVSILKGTITADGARVHLYQLRGL